MTFRDLNATEATRKRKTIKMRSEATGSNATGTHAETADLERLAAELGPLGCKTILVTGDGRLPHLDVLNPQAPVLSGRIYAQADYFWWSHGERIASRDQVGTAGQAIARTLAATPQ